MALCSVEFRGESIDKASSMNVILPDGEGPFAVLYLLHGLSDNHCTWCRRTGIERYAEVAGKDLIIVMPDGGRSFYVNDPRPGGLAYEDFIVRDVVDFCDRTFPTIPSRDARAIAGLSMGGYGAIMLAMRHPEMFSAACSHSAATSFAHGPTPGRPDIDEIAESLPSGEYDCYLLAEKLKRAGRPLAVRMDCGTNDFLVEVNRDYHAHLDRLGIGHVYEEFPGEHNWDYWDRHIRRTLRFVAKNVRGGK